VHRGVSARRAAFAASTASRGDLAAIFNRRRVNGDQQAAISSRDLSSRDQSAANLLPAFTPARPTSPLLPAASR
jgi:hypothetical protein